MFILHVGLGVYALCLVFAGIMFYGMEHRWKLFDEWAIISD